MSLCQVFGATDEDVSELRIISLQDVDLAKLDADASSGDADLRDLQDGGDGPQGGAPPSPGLPKAL